MSIDTGYPVKSLQIHEKLIYTGSKSLLECYNMKGKKVSESEPTKTNFGPRYFPWKDIRGKFYVTHGMGKSTYSREDKTERCVFGTLLYVVTLFVVFSDIKFAHYSVQHKGRQTLLFRGHEGPVNAVAICGKYIYTGGEVRYYPKCLPRFLP